MKTGKWFIKPVLLVTIFVKFGGILTALQPESTVCYYLLSWNKTEVLQSVSPIGSSGTNLLLISP